MSSAKKRVTKKILKGLRKIAEKKNPPYVEKEGRLSSQYKKSIAQDLMSHFGNYYPELSRTQIRRALSYAYQSLRKKK